ncbi:PilW family protein [Gilvimarinus sp. F26214L]|uniref:PilW family protein n=1 Tax=Gilvimarinus sp. DZF01 TaxID=3461371 RepID=UPI004045D4E9
MSTTALNRQSGLTLVELMIALALSLVVATATIQMFVGTRQTQGLNDEINRLQENARFALEILTENIRLAGYTGPNYVGALPAYFLQDACDTFDPCTDDGGASNSDRIAVQFNPPPDDGTETDCTGAVVPADVVIANVYHITSAGGVNSLSCRGYNVDTGSWVAAAQPIISGIDSMQVQYGLDASGDGATAFVSADRVTDWNEVVAVRIGLLVNAGSGTGSGETVSKDYVLLDANKLTFNDKLARQIYTTTAAIHNR